MEADRFDSLTQFLTSAGSRRRALAALGSLISLGALPASARKGRKKPKTPKTNAFGCLDVGRPCRGKDGACCSGLCQGKKPKKGKKDKSTCVAHNEGGCTAERSVCVTGNNTSLCGPEAVCLATTGNAGFCANAAGSGFSQEVNCRPCAKDTDCEAAGFGPGSACVIVDQGFCTSISCAGVNGSSGTACLPPGA